VSAGSRKSGGNNPQLLRGFAVLGYAVTPLHPGVGRAPGVVDLPVQRDPMGYPLVYASSVKGAFKAECGRRSNCVDTNSGRLDCNKCSLCCCLFGHELETGGESAAGLLSVLDMVPLFFPVPSLSHGYLYMTTPYLAARASAVLDAIDAQRVNSLEGLKGLLDKAAELGQSLGEGEAAACSGVSVESSEEKVYIGSTEVKVKEKSLPCNGLEKLLGRLGGLAPSIPRRLIVVSDSDGAVLVEKGLIRLTRVKLRVDTKTVAGTALWTEEYIPQGTVFLSGFLALTPRKNPYCCKYIGTNNSCVVEEKDSDKLLREFINILGAKDCTAYAVIGGKETIGKGLLRLILTPCDKSGSQAAQGVSQ